MPRPTMTSVTGIVVATCIGLVFALHASYPGYLYEDSVTQLSQVFSGEFTDWHPPFVALVWSVLLGVLPGPVGFIVFDNALIWGSLAAIALHARHRAGKWALVLVALPLMPGLFNFIGHVHKDAMLVAWLLGASALAYHASSPTVSGKRATVLRTLANVFIVAAYLTRANAIFCLVPLLLYTNQRLGTKRNLILCTILLVLMPLAQKVQNTAIEVRSESPGDSIKTFHLLALSYMEGRNLFPGEWTGLQSQLIAESCWTPIQWDTASSWGKCNFIFGELQRQRLWGSQALTARWLEVIASHPLDLYSALAATFRISMREPNSRNMLYKPPKTPLVDWEVETDPPRATTALAQDFVRSRFNDGVGRPWVFAVVSALCVAFLLGNRAGRTGEGRFALALLASGQVYLLSYFFFTVSAEYRYFYWSGFAAWLGLLMTGLAVAAGRRARDPLASRKLPPAARHALMAITAVAVGLVAAPFRLPTEVRVVTVTPLDGKPVVLTHLRTASVPPWTGLRFEGQVDAPGWAHIDWELHSGVGAQPVVARIRTLYQGIELALATGPGMGRVKIESGGVARVIDTDTPLAGSAVVVMPPTHPDRANRRAASPLAPLRAALWMLAVLAVLLWLDRRDRNTAPLPLRSAATT